MNTFDTSIFPMNNSPYGLFTTWTICRLTTKTSTIFTMFSDYTIITTVSTIIITSSNISVIMAKSISNQGMISSCTSIYQMTCTFRTGICVCIHSTAVPTIIVAVWSIGLIVTETIANQCNIITTWN